MKRKLGIFLALLFIMTQASWSPQEKPKRGDFPPVEKEKEKTEISRKKKKDSIPVFLYGVSSKLESLKKYFYSIELRKLKVALLATRMFEKYKVKPESIQGEGVKYLAECFVKAVEELRKNQVKSKSSHHLLANRAWEFGLLGFDIMFIEHIGPFRSSKHLSSLRKQLLARFGRKKKATFNKVRSEAGAMGPMQFMKGTYKFMVAEYPTADLKENFKEGATDHVNAIKTQLCFFDWVLSTEQFEDKESLVAAYNGGVTRVSRVKSKYGDSWRKQLPGQTWFYLKKWRAITSL